MKKLATFLLALGFILFSNALLYIFATACEIPDLIISIILIGIDLMILGRSIYEDNDKEKSDN